ncbi:MAG TPA: glycine--tRNA ligase subunit beta [Leptolyngbyaceae cyanobacterium M33_DOE_097]|uniref:Glycine--tRNA ligase beta subunit n=1 Tax=Oscillatoriales cyanobacterium SpSt-418 TaxID=2282169 RepID=A0A7C3PFQ5_9CYAN|nr:glycine--tRNA ligase subunit beta [Leptolyngbyaceae cyanobacterium M33_DOE_097]
MATFLLEVGTEELPADFVDTGLAQWRSRIPAELEAANLPPTSIEYYGTPRRLAVLIKGLPERQPDQVEEVKGPPAQAAFKDGKPTKAAEGFAQKQGVDLSSLEIRSTEKGDFVFARKQVIGRSLAEVLQSLVPEWVTGLEGRRFMRWADGELRFPRPIRWLVALLDDQVLPLELVNASQSVVSDRYSIGHRVLHPGSFAIAHADDYVSTLRAAFVEVDPDQRQARIEVAAKAAAKEIGGVAVISPGLLREVTNLVEWSTAVVGKFDPEFLELPPEVITTEMESHQRYFPIQKQADSPELLPYFITISNGDPAKSALIAEGNGRVIRARLSDGKFFYDADRAQPLESYLDKLETVTFQADLGSVRAKVDRIQQVAAQITAQIPAADTATIQRAALLCKADLVTQMVGEFPELQGIMGEKYAITSGEPKAVAIAIAEHYLPRGAGDRLPVTLVGQVVGIADRLDTLISIFGLGMLPTGSSDPFALRRAANAIVSIIWANQLPLNLYALIEQTTTDFAQQFASVMKLSLAELQQHLRDFFLTRIRTLLLEDENVDYDLVNAVLDEGDSEYTQRALEDVCDVRDRALYLQSLRQDGTLEKIYETINRASRLAKQGQLGTDQLEPAAVIQPSLFQKPSEQAFFDALQQLHSEMKGEKEYQKLVKALEEITPTVSRFFDGADSVMVMDEDLKVRENRLNLLGVLRNHTRLLADFSAVVKGE